MKNNNVIYGLITESQGDLADRMREVFDRGYEQGYEEGKKDEAIAIQDGQYQRGLDDMTEVFKKLYLPHSMGGLNTLDVRAVFGLSLTEPYYKILTDFSAQAIIEKIKAYEEQKKAEEEIKVGDEVIYDGMKGIVSRGIYHIGSDAEEFVTIWLGNHMASCSVKNIEPTGKNNSQFVEVLKQLQEGEE